MVTVSQPEQMEGLAKLADNSTPQTTQLTCTL